MKKMLFVLTVPLLMVGCANQNSIYRTFDISKGESPMVDIRQRAVLVAPNKKVTDKFDKESGKLTEKTTSEKMFVCAEPSPDAMASLAYELAAKGGVEGKAGGEMAFAMHDSAAFTGIRTQSIQLLRDFGYRLCESHLSGAISSAQYDLLMRRFQKNTVALLAIEQLTGAVKSPPIVLTSSGKAEATKSIVEQRAEFEKVDDRISELTKEKGDIETKQKAAKAANAGADTSAMDKQITDLEGKIERLKSDRKAIEDSISNVKGVLAQGRTEVTIKTDPITNQRSDEHLQKIAKVVGDIVNNIVLSDDEKQLCMITLQSSDLTNRQGAFADWCIKNFHNQADATRMEIEQLRDEIRDARTEVSATSDPTKITAEKKKIEEAMKKLERIKMDTQIYNIVDPSLFNVPGK
uniref:Lipoprotein n=1 Tax=Candidatus Kentrum sp. SD TaxID=2126332 RepID=A0A450YFC4_9GAMM|nr:MAG: hypothetical protein BECKSD772F_GA0070984_10568 [Candidatus Kentron sp. SD]VFK45728.1 MAG: hypothetical protein BECKSD772E_GA0070983_10598 [Candidatus Kentron sp. SD]